MGNTQTIEKINLEKNCHIQGRNKTNITHFRKYNTSTLTEQASKSVSPIKIDAKNI